MKITQSHRESPATEGKTDYFILLSYSCLLSMVSELEEALAQGRRGVLLCFTDPIYQFLRTLNDEKEVEVVRIDSSRIVSPTLRHPLSVFRAKRDAEQVLYVYLPRIRTGDAVHFYNRHFATLVGYLVQCLSRQCEIHYAQCDPVGLHDSARGPHALVKWLIERVAYGVPVRVVGNCRPFPELKETFINHVVDVHHPYITKRSDGEKKYLSERLSVTINARVIWVMGNYFGKGFFETNEYLRTLRECIRVVNSEIRPSEQAVKYHPYAREQEKVWARDVLRIPEYVPSQFLLLPEAELVITLSGSARVDALPDSHVRIISLLELLPFLREADRRRFKGMLRSNTEYSVDFPNSLEGFRKLLD